MFNKSPKPPISPSVRCLATGFADLGAKPNAQDHLGYTPLHVAMECTYADSAMTLLELGADPTTCDNQGRTPVQLVPDSVKSYPGIPEVVHRIGQTP
ncbi:ankyrin repeat domain-containing protein [Singulisphaera sp. GP187]|uniref:ankyrin repeat domain-containing protein n=1 Tax=Singulisphaera sp. GP187 TaxID=1882752 RepID=UPI0009FB36C2